MSPDSINRAADYIPYLSDETDIFMWWVHNDKVNGIASGIGSVCQHGEYWTSTEDYGGSEGEGWLATMGLSAMTEAQPDVSLSALVRKNEKVFII